jgi:hypothetical protein
VSSNVPVAQATMQEAVLPERVQEALGELVGAAKEGLLALSVEVGLRVLTEMLEDEVDEVVGPKGKHNPERTAVQALLPRIKRFVLASAKGGHTARAPSAIRARTRRASPSSR